MAKLEDMFGLFPEYKEQDFGTYKPSDPMAQMAEIVKQRDTASKLKSKQVEEQNKAAFNAGVAERVYNWDAYQQKFLDDVERRTGVRPDGEVKVKLLDGVYNELKKATGKGDLNTYMSENVIKPSFMAEMQASAAKNQAKADKASGKAGESSTFLGGVGDVALSLGQSVVGLGEIGGRLVGANDFAGGAANVREWLQTNKTDASQAERKKLQEAVAKAEKSGSTKEEVFAYLDMFKAQPLEFIAETIGPTLGIGAVARVGGKVAAKVLGKEAAKTGAIATGTTAGAAFGLGEVKGNQYETTYNEAIARGFDEPKAKAMAEAASEYSLKNAGQQALGAGLGAVGVLTGPLDKLIMGTAAKAGAKGLAARAATGIAIEGGTEALQEGQGKYAGNVAAIDAGVLDASQAFRGVAGSAALGGVVGGALGGVSGAVSGGASAAPLPDAEFIPEPPQSPLTAKQRADIRAMPQEEAFTAYAATTGADLTNPEVNAATLQEFEALRTEPTIDGAAAKTIYAEASSGFDDKNSPIVALQTTLSTTDKATLLDGLTVGEDKDAATISAKVDDALGFIDAAVSGKGDFLNYTQAEFAETLVEKLAYIEQVNEAIKADDALLARSGAPTRTAAAQEVVAKTKKEQAAAELAGTKFIGGESQESANKKMLAYAEKSGASLESIAKAHTQSYAKAQKVKDEETLQNFEQGTLAALKGDTQYIKPTLTQGLAADLNPEEAGLLAGKRLGKNEKAYQIAAAKVKIKYDDAIAKADSSRNTNAQSAKSIANELPNTTDNNVSAESNQTATAKNVQDGGNKYKGVAKETTPFVSIIAQLFARAKSIENKYDKETLINLAEKIKSAASPETKQALEDLALKMLEKYGKPIDVKSIAPALFTAKEVIAELQQESQAKIDEQETIAIQSLINADEAKAASAVKEAAKLERQAAEAIKKQAKEKLTKARQDARKAAESAEAKRKSDDYFAKEQVKLEEAIKAIDAASRNSTIASLFAAYYNGSRSIVNIRTKINLQLGTLGMPAMAATESVGIEKMYNNAKSGIYLNKGISNARQSNAKRTTTVGQGGQRRDDNGTRSEGRNNKGASNASSVDVPTSQSTKQSEVSKSAENAAQEKGSAGNPTPKQATQEAPTVSPQEMTTEQLKRRLQQLEQNSKNEANNDNTKTNVGAAKPVATTLPAEEVNEPTTNNTNPSVTASSGSAIRDGDSILDTNVQPNTGRKADVEGSAEAVQPKAQADLVPDSLRWEQHKKDHIEGKVISSSDGLNIQYRPADKNSNPYDMPTFTAINKNGDLVGLLKVDITGNVGKGVIEVAENMRRRGIASTLYKLAEKQLGITMKPEDVKTSDATAFWSQKNRGFGNNVPTVAPSAATVQSEKEADLAPSDNQAAPKAKKPLAEAKPQQSQSTPTTNQSNPEVKPITELKFDQWVKQEYDNNEYKDRYLRKFDDESRAMLGAVIGSTDKDTSTADLLKEAKLRYFKALLSEQRESALSLNVWDSLNTVQQIEAQRHFYDLDARLAGRAQDNAAANFKAIEDERQPYRDALDKVNSEIKRLDLIDGPETKKVKELRLRREKLTKAIFDIGQGVKIEGRLLGNTPKPQLSQSTPTTNPTNESNIRTAIEGIFGGIKDAWARISKSTVIVDTAADLPEFAEAIGTNGQAFFVPSKVKGEQGKIYLIADRITKGQEASVWLHEVGHKRLAELLGAEKMKQLYDNVQSWKNKKGSVEQEIFNAANERAENSGDYEGEIIYYAIEETAKRGIKPDASKGTITAAGWLAKVKSLFTAALRKLTGVASDINLSANELMAMAYGAAKLEYEGKTAGAQGDGIQFSKLSDAGKKVEKVVDSAQKALNDAPTIAKRMAALKTKDPLVKKALTSTLSQPLDTARGVYARVMNVYSLETLYGHLFRDGASNYLRRAADLMSMKSAEVAKNMARFNVDFMKKFDRMNNEKELFSVIDKATFIQFDPSGNSTKKIAITSDEKALKARYDKLSPQDKQIYRDILRSNRDQFRRLLLAVEATLAELGVDTAQAKAFVEKMKLGKIEVYFAQNHGDGQYVVQATKKGNADPVFFRRYDSKAEAEAEYELLKNADPTLDVARPALFQDLQKPVFNASIEDTLKRFEDRLRRAGKSEAEIKEASQNMRDVISSSMVIKSEAMLRERKNILGAISSTKFTIRSFTNMENLIAKTKYQHKINKTIADAQKHIDGNDKTNGYDKVAAQQALDSLRDSAHFNHKNGLATKTADYANLFGYLTTIWANVSTPLLNALSLTNLALPYLGARYGYAKASGMLTSSVFKDVKLQFTKPVSEMTGDLKIVAEHAENMNRDHYSNAKEIMDISNNMNPLLSNVITFGGVLQSMSERAVTLQIMLTAYRLEMGVSKNKEKALAASIDAVNKGNPSNAAITKGAYAKTNIGRVLMMLKSFQLDVVVQLMDNVNKMVRSAKDSGDPAKKEEAKIAAKNLGGILIMHGLTAGAIGLPTVLTWTAGWALMGLAGDDEDKDKPVKEWLKEYIYENAGKEIGSYFYYGIFGAGVSKRIGLGDLIYQDRFGAGNDPNTVRDYVFQALGPAAGNINASVKTATIWLEERKTMGEEMATERALKSMPLPVVSNALKGFQFIDDDGIAYTRDGTPLNSEENRLSLGAMMMQIIGYKPSIVAEADADRAATYKILSKVTAQRQALLNAYKLAKNEFERGVGSEENVDIVLRNIEAFNENNPDKEITDKSISNADKKVTKKLSSVIADIKEEDEEKVNEELPWIFAK